jgi:hypothetical protein
LEEAEVAKKAAGVLSGEFNYYNWRSTLRKQTIPRRPIPTAPTAAFGPIVKLNASLTPHLIEEDVFKHLWADARDKAITFPVTVNTSVMSFQDLCTLLMQIFFSGAEPGVPEMYVDTIMAGWTDPGTGNREVLYVYEHNWKDEIALFLTQHPGNEVELGFGLALVEEFAKEENADIPLDPMLFA